jgi:hypothetical protein
MRFFLHDSHFTIDRRLWLAGDLPTLGERRLWDIAVRYCTLLIKKYDRTNEAHSACFTVEECKLARLPRSGDCECLLGGSHRNIVYMRTLATCALAYPFALQLLTILAMSRQIFQFPPDKRLVRKLDSDPATIVPY